MAALDRHAMSHAAVVMAFEPPTWLRLRALRRSLRVGALLLGPGPRADGQGRCRRPWRPRHRAGVAFIGLEHTLVTATAVRQARQAGVALGAWTVNDPSDMRRAIDLGVAIVISDRPDLLREMLRR